MDPVSSIMADSANRFKIDERLSEFDPVQDDVFYLPDLSGQEIDGILAHSSAQLEVFLKIKKRFNMIFSDHFDVVCIDFHACGLWSR